MNLNIDIKKLKELILAVRINQIKPLPKEPHSRAYSICAYVGISWNPTLTDSVISEENRVTHLIDEEEQLRHEKLLKEREVKVNGFLGRLTDDAEGIMLWEFKNGYRVGIRETKAKWFHIFKGQAGVLHSDGSLKPMEVYCPKEGMEYSLEGSLDGLLKPVAEEIVDGRRAYPSQLELYRILEKVDPLTVRCGVVSSDQCLGYASRYNGGSVLCFVQYAKLVPK